MVIHELCAHRMTQWDWLYEKQKMFLDQYDEVWSHNKQWTAGSGQTRENLPDKSHPQCLLGRIVSLNPPPQSSHWLQNLRQNVGQDQRRVTPRMVFPAVFNFSSVWKQIDWYCLSQNQLHNVPGPKQKENVGALVPKWQLLRCCQHSLHSSAGPCWAGGSVSVEQASSFLPMPSSTFLQTTPVHAGSWCLSLSWSINLPKRLACTILSLVPSCYELRAVLLRGKGIRINLALLSSSCIPCQDPPRSSLWLWTRAS